MSINFEKKFYQFNDISAIFSIVTAIAGLNTIIKNGYTIDNECEEHIVYTPIKYDENYLNYNIASFLFCCYLYTLQSEFVHKNYSEYAKKIFYEYILNDIWKLDYTYEDYPSELRAKLDYVWNYVNNYNNALTEIFEAYLLNDYRIERHNYYEILIVFNRVVHDNINFCFINESIQSDAFEKTMNKIIGNHIIKNIIDEIITNVPPCPPESNDSNRIRSSCLAQIYINGTPKTYFAISGIWDRGMSKDPHINALLAKPALKLSKSDKTKISLVKEIGKQNKWNWCFIDAYTESYYSVYTDDKNIQRKNFLTIPLKFIDDLIQNDNKKQLDDKNHKYNGRLFSCGERKIMSYMKYDSRFKPYHNIKTIIFYVDRKPCYICNESFTHFKNALNLKRLHIKYKC